MHAWYYDFVVHIKLQTNTFQGVIITDSVQSYYVFSYICGKLEWSGLGSETAIVGFNSNAEYFDNHPANGLGNISRIVACGIQEEIQMTDSGDGSDGTLSGPLPANVTLQEAKMRCMVIALSDDTSFIDINALRDVNDSDVSQLPKCPPTRLQLDISTEFQPFPAQTEDCYRSNDIFRPFGGNLTRQFDFVSVCCYGTSG